MKDNNWGFFASGIMFFSQWEPLSLRKENFQSGRGFTNYFTAFNYANILAPLCHHQNQN